jgi:hypothetical protein
VVGVLILRLVVMLVPFVQPAVVVVSIVQLAALVPPFVQLGAMAVLPAQLAVVATPEATAGRWIPAALAPQVYRSADLAFLAVRFALPLVAVPVSTALYLDLLFRRRLSPRALSEDFAFGSQSPSSQPKGAAKEQGAQRLPLRRRQSQQSATRFEVAWSEHLVSAAEVLPANVGLSRNQFVV